MRNEEPRDIGTRNEGPRNEERRCSTALLHRAARARRRGSFSRQCIGAMRTVRSCGLRLDAGIGPRVRYALYGGSIDRITCKPRFTRIDLPDYLCSTLYSGRSTGLHVNRVDLSHRITSYM